MKFPPDKPFCALDDIAKTFQSIHSSAFLKYIIYTQMVFSALKDQSISAKEQSTKVK